jgi:hypothetical protein
MAALAKIRSAFNAKVIPKEKRGLKRGPKKKQ